MPEQFPPGHESSAPLPAVFEPTQTRADFLEALREHSLVPSSSKIRIAVLDGPVNTDHEDFRRASLKLLDFGTPRPKKLHGSAAAHGTHITSIILGNQGLSHESRGLLIPIYRQTPEGDAQPTSQESLAQAIHLAIDHGAQLINISGGQREASGQARPALQKAIHRAKRNNVLIVAAAGNDGCACLHIPGALASVLAVAAADSQGRPLPSSNWSGPYQNQGILAPGHRISGAKLSGGFEPASGSSYAAAMTTGVAALLLGTQQAAGQKPDPHGIRQAILTSAERCDPSEAVDCHRYLVGHLNPRAALSLILNGDKTMNEPAENVTLDSAFAPQAETSPAASADTLPSSAEPPPASAAEGLVPSSDGVESATSSNAGQMLPAGCGCQGNNGLVYVLGQIDYDFGTLENFDWFKQNAQVDKTFINPNDPRQILAYLDENPEFAKTLIWTVTISGVPVYAIEPEDCFCNAVYKRLREFLALELKAREKCQGVVGLPVTVSSIPAVIKGTRRLLSNAVVPALQPDPRGMFIFDTEDIGGDLKDLLDLDDKPTSAQVSAVKAYLEYLVDKLRNLGQSAADRAKNYLAVQGIFAVFGSVFEAGNSASTPELGDVNIDNFRLSSVVAEQSLFCLPGGDCQDVSLTFFDPSNAVDIAPLVFRQTVDVAAVNPVLVGNPATFRIR